MSVHWNVQLSVQRVELNEKSIPSADRRAGVFAGVPRQITKTLDLAVTADSEAEAYDKIRRILDANQEQPVQGS